MASYNAWMAERLSRAGSTVIRAAAFGALLSSVMASQWIGRGLFWQASGITIVAGIVSVGLDLVMIPRYGMYGAVVSTLVTYGFAAITNAAMAFSVDRRVARLVVRS